MSSQPHSAGRRRDAYRLLWRWHFYAGLFCLPFVLWLACTGLIYLFRPQVEPWLDRAYSHVTDGPAQPLSAQVQAALAAVPGTVLNAYELPSSPHAAVRVLLGRGGELTRVYLDPSSLRVLHVVRENDRFMRQVFYLHGELMAGTPGSMLVELAASWTILLLLTGLYLWWPRGRRLGGVLYPRLGHGGRVFWRDLHAVTGLWVSLFALCLLISGLPWAKSWGGLLRDARQSLAHAAVVQDWTIGSADERKRIAEANTPPDEHAMHGDMPGMAGMSGMHAMAAAPVDYRALDRLLPAVQAERLAPPVLIAPPSAKQPAWSARSDADNRALRADLTLDPQRGQVIKRVDFAQRPWLDRLIGYGVAVHEGVLFPPLNQILSAFTALGLITMVISASVLWWRRRPAGTLGAPGGQHVPRYAPGFVVLLCVLGVLLPLLGATLLLVLAMERLLLRRLPRTRHFLGLACRPGEADGH